MASLELRHADLARLPDKVGSGLPDYRGTVGEQRISIWDAAPVLEAGGVVFAAGVSLLTYLIGILRDDPADFVRRHVSSKRYWEDGNVERPITVYTSAAYRATWMGGGAYTRLASTGSSALASRHSPASRSTPAFMPYRRSQGLGAACRYRYIGKVKKR